MKSCYIHIGKPRVVSCFHPVPRQSFGIHLYQTISTISTVSFMLGAKLELHM